MVRASVIALCALLAAGCAGGPRPLPDENVPHPIIDTAGKAIGTVTVKRDPRGWAIIVETKGLVPGNHGIHMHEVGRCDAPGFTTAGAHFNPNDNHHGAFNPDPRKPHRGDMDNLLVTADGEGNYAWVELWDPRIATKGLALVIHAKEDDNKTDPSGNSGDRIACGVVFPAGAAEH